MVSKMLFIEGTTEDDNGDLSEGFRYLLEQKLKGKVPRIHMGDGKMSTIDMFKHTRYKNKKTGSRCLLIDLDGKEEKRENDLKENDLDGNNCFYMIQEMETWFISQSATVLDVHYKSPISNRLTKKSAVDFNNPDEEIDKHLKSLGKEYHKVKDGVKMLKLLNLDKLMVDFPDVKNLVEELQKP